MDQLFEHIQDFKRSFVWFLLRFPLAGRFDTCDVVQGPKLLLLSTCCTHTPVADLVYIQEYPKDAGLCNWTQRDFEKPIWIAILQGN